MTIEIRPIPRREITLTCQEKRGMMTQTELLKKKTIDSWKPPDQSTSAAPQLQTEMSVLRQARYSKLITQKMS